MYIYSYFAIDGTPLYVGSTGQVLQRFRQHQREDAWMANIATITVRGPYPGKLVDEFERMYVSKLHPAYNSNLLYYNDCSDFYDDTDVRSFSSVTEFVEYYTLCPDTYQRGTYYLRSEDLEAIRLLCFYTHSEKSALVRDALKIGLTEIGKEINHENIYGEARRMVCKAIECKK